VILALHDQELLVDLGAQLLVQGAAEGSVGEAFHGGEGASGTACELVNATG
jgi:hypothetical protein